MYHEEVEWPSPKKGPSLLSNARTAALDAVRGTK